MQSEKYLYPKVMYGTWRSRPPTLSRKDDLSDLVLVTKDQRYVDLAKISPKEDEAALTYFDKNENDNYFHQQYSTSKCNPHYNSDNEDDKKSSFNQFFGQILAEKTLKDDARRIMFCESLKFSNKNVNVCDDEEVDHTKTTLLDSSTVKSGTVKNLKLLFETNDQIKKKNYKNDQKKHCNYTIPKHNTIVLSKPQKTSIPKAIIKPFITKPKCDSSQMALNSQQNNQTKIYNSTELFDEKSSCNSSHKSLGISTLNTSEIPSKPQPETKLESKEETNNSKLKLHNSLSMQTNNQNNVLRSSKIFKRRKKLVSRAAEIASSFRCQEDRSTKLKKSDSNSAMTTNSLKENNDGIIQTIKIDRTEVGEENNICSESKKEDSTDNKREKFFEIKSIEKNMEVYVDLESNSIQVNSLIRSKRPLDKMTDKNTDNSNDRHRTYEIILTKQTLIDMNYSEQRKDILKMFINTFGDKVDKKSNEVDLSQKQWLLEKLEFIL